MNKLISITSSAADQIKKILSNAPDGMDSILVGVDKSGCSGYSYKLDFANSSELKNFESIDKDGIKVLIDPKAIIFLLGSIMDYRTDKLLLDLYLIILMKELLDAVSLLVSKL